MTKTTANPVQSTQQSQHGWMNSKNLQRAGKLATTAVVATTYLAFPIVQQAVGVAANPAILGGAQATLSSVNTVNLSRKIAAKKAKLKKAEAPKKKRRIKRKIKVLKRQAASEACQAVASAAGIMGSNAASCLSETAQGLAYGANIEADRKTDSYKASADTQTWTTKVQNTASKINQYGPQVLGLASSVGQVALLSGAIATTSVAAPIITAAATATTLWNVGKLVTGWILA